MLLNKLLNFVNNTLFPKLKELPVTPDTPVKKVIVKSTFEDAKTFVSRFLSAGDSFRLLEDLIEIVDAYKVYQTLL